MNGPPGSNLEMVEVCVHMMGGGTICGGLPTPITSHCYQMSNISRCVQTFSLCQDIQIFWTDIRASEPFCIKKQKRK